MALLPAGHINSHHNVATHQAGCQGSGHWAWTVEPSSGRPAQHLWMQAGSRWGCGQRECLPGHVLLLGQGPWGSRQLCGLSTPDCSAHAQRVTVPTAAGWALALLRAPGPRLLPGPEG
ncbi:Ewing'S Tumor-Associated Antigen 1 [Manis pentadactyla]|nr:Ewing'S Tumor-Associated Antigen 1 [Manis pentadactyla]